jgi:glucokinase
MAVLAADIGGTRIKLGIVSQGRVIARTAIPAEPESGLAAALLRTEAAWRGLCQGLRVKPAELAAVGLAFPGLIYPPSGRILSAPAGKFDDATSLNLHAWAQRCFSLPLTVSNDANAALAGEWHYGAARGCRSVVMVTLGTGIGTSVIIDGTPLRGEHGQAGNLGGHFVQSLEGRPCPCGNLGCAESEASNWAVEILARSDADFAQSALAGERQVDLGTVFRCARGGDLLAEKLRDHCLKVWAGLAVSLIHAYDPERLVLGGGVMQSAEIILPAVQSYVDRHAWTPWGKVQILAAALGNDAGMLGVGYFAEQLLNGRGHANHAGMLPADRPAEGPAHPRLQLPRPVTRTVNP